VAWDGRCDFRWNLCAATSNASLSLGISARGGPPIRWASFVPCPWIGTPNAYVRSVHSLISGGSWPVQARRRMVERDLIPEGIRDPRVLAAMAKVPRDRFVPSEFLADAYADRPLPIGLGQRFLSR
jgi:hypothetical protein